MAERDTEIKDRKNFEKRDLSNLLNPKELQHIKDSFKSKDPDNRKELDIQQIKQCFEKYNVDLDNDEEFKELFDQVERNGKISIDFDEFIDIITGKLSEMDKMENLDQVFELFIQKENTDKIEFRHLRNICPDLTDEEIEEMIEKADEDKDGKINFEEFYNFITKRF